MDFQTFSFFGGMGRGDETEREVFGIKDTSVLVVFSFGLVLMQCLQAFNS